MAYTGHRVIASVLGAVVLNLALMGRSAAHPVCQPLPAASSERGEAAVLAFSLSSMHPVSLWRVSETGEINQVQRGTQGDYLEVDTFEGQPWIVGVEMPTGLRCAGVVVASEGSGGCHVEVGDDGVDPILWRGDGCAD